jgi:hypothetical protein
MILPGTCAKSAGGTRVVFPAPGGATSTAAPPASFATNSGKTLSIGNMILIYSPNRRGARQR